MTDKHIIIDGVDVSGCEFYESNGMCSCSLVYYDYCKDFPNCVYKLSQKLKAKEQECEELKAEIKLTKEMLIQNTSETNKYTIPQIIEEFISDNYIDQQNDDGYTIPVFIQIENILDIKETLEQQLDQLKAENETLKSFDINLVGVKECEIRQLVQYRKTLTEIKAEMRKILMVGNGIDGKYRPVKNSSKQDCYQVLGKIQEILGTNQIKISECEAEDEN